MKQDQQQSQMHPVTTDSHLQNTGIQSSQEFQQQRRPSVSIQGFVPENPHPSPLPAYATNPSQTQLNSMQTQHLQQSLTEPVSVDPSVTNHLAQQQCHQHHTQQPQMVMNHASPSTLIPSNAGQQSQSNSLNPSPVSQPAVIQPIAPQQLTSVMQPVLNYQNQQIQAQGFYTQPPITILQSPISYANKGLISPGQAIINPSTQHLAGATNAEIPAVAPPPGSPNEVVKRGRFRITKGGKNASTLTENSSINQVGGYKEPVENVSSSEHGSTGVEAAATQPDSSITKKKGRFVVKTATCALPPSIPNVIVSGETNPEKVINHTPVNVEASVNIDDSKAVEVPIEVSAGNDEKKNEITPHVQPVVNEISSSAPVNHVNVSAKKKGRFVVKKGGNAARTSTPPPQHESSSLDGSTSKHSIPTVVSTITHSFQDASSHAPLQLNLPIVYQTQQQICAQAIAAPMTNNATPISNVQATQPVGAYDMNGNFVLVSAPIIAPPNQNTQQATQSNHVNLASIPTQSINTASQPNHSTARLPALYSPDVQKQKKLVSVPKAPRPTEHAASRPTIGSRIFGTTGVGKVLHHLESVRLEVIEADKSLSSLQSDYRILKDKNKELEARNAKLERLLAEERAKNKKLAKSAAQNHFETNNQVKKKDATSTNATANLKELQSNNLDQKKISDTAVNSSSPPKQSDQSQHQETCTPINQNKQFALDANHPIEHSFKENSSLNDSNSQCNSYHEDNKSLSNSPRPNMAPDRSTFSKSSDTASNLLELSMPGADSSLQPVRVVNSFDPLMAGTVVVPVLVPTPPPNEKGATLFDPLGTPKRSGASRLFSNTSNMQQCSELGSVPQVPSFAVPQIDVSTVPIPTVFPLQPIHAPAESSIQQATIVREQLQSSNLHVNQEEPDPFDEIALRHGNS